MSAVPPSPPPRIGDSDEAGRRRSTRPPPQTLALSPEWNAWVFENRNTIAALSASFCSTVAGFPLDSVKSRLQVKRYSSVLDCARRTYADEGVRGFFRGVTIPLITITLVRTISFNIYTGTKEKLHARGWVHNDSVRSTASSGFLGGAASGLLLSIGTTAFEFTKIKLQLEYLIAMKKGVPYEPRGTIRGFLDLYRAGGIRGLYTGFRLHALRDTLGTGFYFGMYDASQLAIQRNADKMGNPPPIVTTFACGSAAGVASWALVYPIDLVKAKVQRNALADAAYERPWHVFRRLSSGGVTRLYRGLGISAGRSVFTHGLLWTILEQTRGSIIRRTGHSYIDDARQE
ncbi:hypothetical protein JCM11491_006383 [Sporobolomyces phaffii]